MVGGVTVVAATVVLGCDTPQMQSLALVPHSVVESVFVLTDTLSLD